MELKGTVIQVLEAKTGEGKNGAWKKQDYILETKGEYPKKVCVEVWNKDEVLKVGAEIVASLDIESREYNGNWYTNVKMWKHESATPNTDEAISKSEDETPF